MQSAQKYRDFGMPFQVLLIIAFTYRAYAYDGTDVIFWADSISWLGWGIFAYCLFILYVLRNATRGLITTGLFRFTRHPMYTGLLFMDVRLWFTAKDAMFLVSLFLFLVGILIAGYLQEKETLARFGKQAEQYYERTPRIFIFSLLPIKRRA